MLWKGERGMPSYAAAALCFGVMTGLYLCYQAEKYRKKRNKRRELRLKSGATLTAAALAAYGFALRPTGDRLLLLAGIFVCAVADAVLDLHFLAGTAAFGLGHICFCVSSLLAQKPGWQSLAVFLMLAALIGAVYPRVNKAFAPDSAWPYLLYALLISLMLALALPQKPALLLGAGLFVASDCLLLIRIVRKIPSKAYDYTCMAVYYLAQFLIAVSTLM